MIKYQRINGVSLSDATGLPSIKRTPEGEAMGAVPGWAVLLDPDYSGVSGIRNRAAPNAIANYTSPSVYQIGQFPNGAPSFNHDVSGKALLSIPGGPINPAAWTAFMVTAEIPASATISRRYLFVPSETQEGVLPISVAIVRVGNASDELIIYENAATSPGQPRRLDVEHDFGEGSGTQLVMATFSVEHGLSLWANGKRIAVNVEDKRPLDYALDTRNLQAFWGFRAHSGMTGLLNIDLNAPENTGHRRSIERFLMAKYDIPEGS